MKSATLFDLDNLRYELDRANREMEEPDFWNDQERAQKLMREKGSMEQTIGKIEKLESTIKDIEDMIELAEMEEDHEMAELVIESFDAFKNDLEELRIRTLLSGKYDRNGAILAIHAGTGGLDAQDWAQMLFRMYTRWAEAKGYKITVLDYQKDEEAGIKTATITIEGENAYGYLKTEKGVHRLVRLSPYNAQNKRQTSFAKIEVTPVLDNDVTVEIDPGDLKIDTYRSSGAGGQHINKTDSAIRITHIPTGIVVTCQNERSQFQNKDMAMSVLKAKLLALKEEEHKENIKELKGNLGENTWGSQIRSYVFQPYTMVKDHRTGEETANVNAVMDGAIDRFITAKLTMKDEELKK